MTGKAPLGTVLLIDDDEALLELLGAYLEDEGYRVLTASNGVDGIKRAYDEHPDIIVLDIMMPRMDGWATAQRLREMSDVPLIILTAKTAEKDVLRGFRLGTDDYVTKPFSFAELAARVTALLSRSEQADTGPAGPTRYAFGDLEIDFDAHRVIRSGQTISLTPVEFRLLRCLVENEGMTLSQDRLLEEVWGSSSTYDPGYVRRYVWYLRQKLEDDPAAPRYIHTERGYGYRFGLD